MISRNSWIERIMSPELTHMEFYKLLHSNLNLQLLTNTSLHSPDLPKRADGFFFGAFQHKYVSARAYLQPWAWECMWYDHTSCELSIWNKLVTSDNLCIYLPIWSSLVKVIENGQRSKIKGKHLKLWQSFESTNLSV